MKERSRKISLRLGRVKVSVCIKTTASSKCIKSKFVLSRRYMNVNPLIYLRRIWQDIVQRLCWVYCRLTAWWMREAVRGACPEWRACVGKPPCAPAKRTRHRWSPPTLGKARSVQRASDWKPKKANHTIHDKSRQGLDMDLRSHSRKHKNLKQSS